MVPNYSFYMETIHSVTERFWLKRLKTKDSIKARWWYEKPKHFRLRPKIDVSYSVVVASLRSNTSGIQLSIDQESWIMSLSLISMLPSQLLSGYLSYKFGRRLIMTLSAIPVIASLFLLKLFCTYESLLAGSLLYGIAGAGFSTGPMYIAEVTSPKYRSVLLNLRIVSMLFGLLMAHLLGGWFHWNHLIPYGFISAVAGMVTSATSPESPTWLASQGKIEECRKSFKWFRGNEDKEELEKLIERRKLISPKAPDVKVKGISKIKQTFKILTDKSFIKAMGLCVACILFVDINGKFIFNFYFIDGFGTILSEKKSAYYVVAGIDFIDLVTTSFSFVTARKFNMRTLLFKAGFSAVFTILVFCTTSYLFANNTIPSRFRWMTLVLVSIYLVLLNVGVIPTLYCILNEVIPMSHRELGLTLSGIVFVAIMFLTVKFTPYTIKHFELHGTFLIIAAVLSISLLYLYFYLPETRNKTLQDIEIELSGKTNVGDETAARETKSEEALITPNFAVVVEN